MVPSFIISFILRLYAVGGRDGSSCLRSVECFDPHANRSAIITPTLFSSQLFFGVKTPFCTWQNQPDSVRAERARLSRTFIMVLAFICSLVFLNVGGSHLICNSNRAGGIAALLWQKGVEALAWQLGTAFFTPSEGTMPQPRLFHPGWVTAWRGESMHARLFNSAKNPNQSD